MEGAPKTPKEHLKRMREILEGKPLSEAEREALRDAIHNVAPERLSSNSEESGRSNSWADRLARQSKREGRANELRAQNDT